MFLTSVTSTIGVTLGGYKAFANQNCTLTSPGNFFDGKANYGLGTITGVSADIVVRNGGLCNYAPNGFFYSGWSMITGHNGNGYAQSGFDYTLGGPAYDRDFAQANGCTGCVPVSNFTTTQVNPGTSYHYYTILNLYGYWLMYRGNTLLLTSNFQSSAWTYPLGIQFFGEVSDNGGGCLQYCGDDQPGSPTATMGETDLQTQAGGTWSNNIGALTSSNDNTVRWSQGNVITCLDGQPCFGIWTQTP